MIAPAAFIPNIYLFNPARRIVGQEDDLGERMRKKSLKPILLRCIFVFHFKSITVAAASLTQFLQVVRRYKNISVVSLAKFPTVQLVYQDGISNHSLTVDIREDIRWYHSSSKADPLYELLNKKTKTFLTTDNTSFSVWGKFSCRPNSSDVLFPPVRQRSMPDLLNVYQKYSFMSWNIFSDTACIYPSHWHHQCENYLNGDQSSDFQLYSQQDLSTFVVAFAISGNASPHFCHRLKR